MAKTILFIEDDLDIQRLYSMKLDAAGFKVLLSVDAEQGLTQLKKQKPDLILLDIMLPGKMNGFEFLKTIKEDESLKKIPVVVLTNLDTEKEEALNLGAVDYIIKANINLNDIVEKVKSYLK